MACQYFYDGKFYEENDFKKLLNDGLLDQLLIDKTINLDSFVPSQTTLDKFNNKGSQPVRLRILRKIQSHINNQRVEGRPSEPDLRNPLDVLKKAKDENGKDIPLQFVINVAGKLRTGDSKTGDALLKEIEEHRKNNLLSPLSETLPEGYVYMLIPSSYGPYPIRVFTNKIKDTDSFNNLKQNLINLKEATREDVITEARKNIESILYRTTVEFENGNFIINQIDNKNNTISFSYETIEEVSDFLGDQIHKVDYFKINKGDYNKVLANNKVIQTDLFSENGNFFNSSSFLIEGFNLSQEQKSNIEKIFEVKESESGSFIANSIEGQEPVTESNNKREEDPLYGLSLQEIADLEKEQQEQQESEPTIEETTTPVDSKEKKSIIQQVQEDIEQEIERSEDTTTDTTEEQIKTKEETGLESLLRKGEVESENPNISDMFDGFDESPDTSYDPTVKERTTEKVDGTTWNKKEELAWLEGVMGDAYKRQSGRKGTVRVFKNFESLRHYLPKQTYEMLLEARKNGKVLHGLFTEAAVLLSENAQTGVAYHEAFHVIFNLALKFEDRIKILQETYSKYEDEIIKTKKLEDIAG